MTPHSMKTPCTPAATLTALLALLPALLLTCLPGCKGPDRDGRQPHATALDDITDELDSNQSQGLTGPGVADPAGNPSSGYFFDDGADGAVRGRTENQFLDSRSGAGTTSLAPPGFDVFSVGGADGTIELPRIAAHGVPIDEFVIVERADGQKSHVGPDRYSSLRAKVGDRALGHPLPLTRTDVDGKVTLNLASVTVTQRFQNPFARKIEAVYVFPLPQDAAVSDFVMQIGERRIRGIVREREEARQIYEAARAAGHRASLLTQERPNVFTQSVANLEPGQAIDVETTYFQALPWRDGAFEMVVPTVVGPRFHPPGSTDGIGALAANQPAGVTGQTTEVSYVDASDGAPHVLGLRVELDARMPLDAITCRTHPVTIERSGEGRATIALRHDDVPNRDFVLRFVPEGDDLQGALAVHRDPQTGEGWFTLLVQPPVDGFPEAPAPAREMVFVVDCSGSMRGEPLAVCKQMLRRCIARLRPVDTLRVVRFSDQSASLGPGALPATEDTVRRALQFVDDLRANGGTMMERGVLAALQLSVDPERQRIVTFLTDGFIGNEDDILRAVHDHVGDARVFSFGVGTSTNRYLLERMADTGHGVAAFAGLDGSGLEEIEALYRRLERPALTDLRLDWKGARVDGVQPTQLPDSFAGRPLLVHGRVRGSLPDSVELHGRIGGQPRTFTLPVGTARSHECIPKLWARATIRTLHDALAWTDTPDELQGEILRLALEHGLVSDYTAFLAVDASQTTEGDHGTTLRIPAPLPRGVRYDTTVSGAK